ncbi:MAG: hypothetical protein HZB59_05875 [Ignavibacteriales bacterium]|nr:hypothetical protein [Ignavibacteriales bacterium]
MVATAFMIVMWFAGFTQKTNQKFDEIDVQRINIVEKDGKPRLILSNRELAPDLIIKGKTQQRATGRNSPGIIFFNDDGTESGALMSASSRGESGSYTATSRLVFDQFESDELMALQYIDESGKRYAGLFLWDRPETPMTPEIQQQIRAIWKMPEGSEKNKALNRLDSLGVYESERVFIGKTQRKSATVNLSDLKGNTRIRLWVDSLGTPRLDFLDQNGGITYRLPDSARASSQH